MSDQIRSEVNKARDALDLIEAWEAQDSGAREILEERVQELVEVLEKVYLVVDKCTVRGSAQEAGWSPVYVFPPELLKEIKEVLGE